MSELNRLAKVYAASHRMYVETNAEVHLLEETLTTTLSRLRTISDEMADAHAALVSYITEDNDAS